MCVSEEVSGLRVVGSLSIKTDVRKPHRVILLSFVDIAYQKPACTFGALQNNSYFDPLPRRRDGSAHRRLPHVEDDHLRVACNAIERDNSGIFRCDVV